MRDPERIPEMLDLIEEIWILRPDLRLGQLLLNVNVDYQTEDDVLLRLLREAYP